MDPRSKHVPRLLVVEDDRSIGESMLRAFCRAGYQVDLVSSLEGAVAAVKANPPDCAVLDLNLPDGDGLVALAQWRARHRFPVVVVTARAELADRLRSFEVGAADYVAKPFWMEELLARVNARTRQRPDEPRSVMRVGDVEVEPAARVARRDGQDLGLTPTELSILIFLLERPNRAVTRAQLATAALAGERTLERTVDSHVVRLRKKLGPTAGGCVVAVWGIGYKLERPP